MEDSKRPTLSIVIPFFNQKELVAEMFDSILANDFQDWELLAVDDGSDPEAIVFLKHYEEDSRIRILHRDTQPKGAPTCRNIGMERARGEYIIFFDSDDYITPSCLRTRIEAIEKRHDLDFMVFPSGTFAGHTLHTGGTNDYGYPVYKDDLSALLRRTLPFVVVNNIYRADALRSHSITWETQLHSFQDSDFNIQALLRGLKYDYAPTAPDYGYRIAGNTNSISKKIVSERHRQSHLFFLNKQWEEVQQRYGNRYQFSLYLCALYIAFFTMSNGLEKAYSSQLAAVVKSHSRTLGFIYNAQMRFGIFLSRFVPAKSAVRLVFAAFLIRRKWHERIIPQRIRKIREKA